MADWETLTPKAADDGWESVKPVVAPATKSQPLPANAGLGNLATSLLGLPVDTVANTLNLGIAGAGVLTGTTPETIKKPWGGSEWLREQFRSTGIPGLSPDNPNPADKMGTAQYDFVSRGGIIPGGALPAAGSMIAEKLGGPAWAGVGALAPGAIAQGARAAVTAGQNSAVQTANQAQGRLLKSEGVQLTPGQALGGGAKRMEDAATSIPVLGDAIKAAQRRGIEQFGAATINRALEPIGERLPKGMSGNKAVEFAYGKLGDAYDALLPNLKGDLNARPQTGSQMPVAPGQEAVNRAAAPSLREELNTIKAMGESLPDAYRGQLNRIIDNEVLKRFTPSGIASGETLKQIESQLSSIAKPMKRSDNYDARTLGGAVDEVRGALKRMVEYANPEYAGELAKINSGYSQFKIAQNAASSVAAQDGVFTAAQLHRAVKAGDQSKDKARFAEGNALMQDLSSAGKGILPSSVPDSGTPLRSALMYMLAHPLKAGALSVPIGLGALPYTQTGQGALSRFAAGGEQPALARGILQGILSEQQQR